MFKSIHWKIIIMFMSLIIAAEVIVGTASVLSIVKINHSNFKTAVSSVFTEEVKNELDKVANEVTFPVDDNRDIIVIEESSEENVNKINDIIKQYTGPLAISSYRFYDILDGSTGEVLYSSNNAAQTETTPVIASALLGNEDMYNSITGAYMDYAIPLKSGDATKYIVYIKDTLDLQSSYLSSFIKIELLLILFSVIVSFIMGNTISKSITIPIRELIVKAKKLADGDLNALEESSSRDELGNLTNSLVYLAHSRQESTDRALNEKVKVETILQNMSDGVLAFDLKGKLIHINPEAQRLLHRKYLDDIRFDRFFKEINVEITLGDLLYMKPEGSVEREVRLENQYLVMNFATFNMENKVGGVIVVIRDATKQELLEKARRDFVADVSHELRTPLTIIKSYADILADTPDADRELQTRFLGTISSETDRMTRIISDLLTLSKLDENQANEKKSDVIDIRNMIESLVERLQLSARKKNQLLVYTPMNEVPSIEGDKGALERVFINVITNALKYTQSGGTIEIYSSKVYKDICVKIKDNGIGIPKDKLPNIFDRFYRVEKARSRDKGGTGLGLAIAKQTIESSFNGKIKITSELNKGTEVTITIPI